MSGTSLSNPNTYSWSAKPVGEQQATVIVGSPETWLPQMLLTLGTRNPGLSWEDKTAHSEAACH